MDGQGKAEPQVAKPLAEWLTGRWVEAAILLGVLLLQIPLILNADLGWLLTVCEKMLAGARLGIDVIELNPPLSVLMYMPAVLLAKVIPLPPEIFVIVLLLALIRGVAGLTVGILRPMLADRLAERRALLILLLTLALVPGATFGQRDQIASVMLVPFVALASVRWAGAMRPPLPILLLAGVGAGLAMSIKPHYAMAAGLPLLWNAVRMRTWRPLFGLECWIAGIVVVGYFATVYLTFPSYFAVYPRWAAAVYLPLRAPWSFLLGIPTLFSGFGLVVMLWLTRGRERSRWHGAAAWLLAALGAFLSFLLQGKGWAYTRQPTVEFGLLASLLAPSLLNGQLWPELSRIRRLTLVCAILPPVLWLVPAPNDSTFLLEPIRAIAPPHPRMLMISDNVGLGEPLVRKLGGEWVSSAGSQLMAGSAIMVRSHGKLDADKARIADQIITIERDRLRADLLRQRPDVLLIDHQLYLGPFDWEAWARQDPVIAHELDAHYRFVRRLRTVAIWVRRPDPA